MKSLQLGSLAAAAIVTVALPAHAVTFDMKGGQYSKVVGALHETFNPIGGIDPKDALDLTFTSGGLKPSTFIIGATPKEGEPGYKCYKPNFIGNAMCQQGGRDKPGFVTFDFSSKPLDYFGLRWATIDGYVSWQDQHIKIYNGNTLLKAAGTKHSAGTMGARDLRPTIDMPSTGYVNIYAEGTEKFTKVVLFTNVRSFEFGNLAIRYAPTPVAPTISPMVAVPEASTYAMLAAGLGVVGFMARRRQRA